MAFPQVGYEIRRLVPPAPSFEGAQCIRDGEHHRPERLAWENLGDGEQLAHATITCLILSG